MSHYADRHRDKTNLTVHLVAVPLFIIAHLGLAASLWTGHLAAMAISAFAIVLSLALQGRGHKREKIPPDPFKSPADFLKRIYIEQFHTFPRYLLTQEFRTNWQAARTKR